MPETNRNELGQIVEHSPNAVTREEVKDLIANGATQELAANALGITRKTLRKHYRDEIEDAKSLLIGRIEGVAYRKALDGDMKAVHLVLRTQGGWIEEHRNTGGGAQVNILVNGQAPQIAASKPMFAMTPKALAALNENEDDDNEDDDNEEIEDSE